MYVFLFLQGNALNAVWAMTPVPVSQATNSNQMERAVMVSKLKGYIVCAPLKKEKNQHNERISFKHSQISTSVCWEPATVGEESVVSTQRAHSVARERSAVGPAMNSLTPTIAKVSHSVRCPSVCLCYYLKYWKSVFNFPAFSLPRYWRVWNWYPQLWPRVWVPEHPGVIPLCS